MKSQNSFLKGLLIVFLIINFTACKKQEDVVPSADNQEIQEEPGISADTFETYAGDIGIIINARDIAAKGYQPSKAELKIEAQNSDFSQTISLNDISYMGELKIPVDSLSRKQR